MRLLVESGSNGVWRSIRRPCSTNRSLSSKLIASPVDRFDLIVGHFDDPPLMPIGVSQVAGESTDRH
jgi:hypothetical protein